ncbi:macrosialin [Hoplias malabaricus]|uniref:macrosialin n=1 Tax=Hoplias malabaricus TaxID=27720 RepID=UPI003461B0FD
MAEIKYGAITLLATFFILTAAFIEAQENKPPATVFPPAKFGSTLNPSTPTTTTTTKPTTTTSTTTSTTTTTTSTTTTAHQNKTTTQTTVTTTTASTTKTSTTATTPKNITTTATTTTASTTITPKPGPTPKTNVTTGNYTVKYSNNSLCIMVLAAIQLSVHSPKTNGTFIVQPNAAQFDGKCQTNTSYLDISFKEGNISLSFIKNDTSKMVYVNSLTVKLDYAFSPGATFTFLNTNKSLELFTMKAGHSYSCKSESIYLGRGLNLELSQQRIQAFDFDKNQFGPIDLCKADQPNYTVAIVVGIVLIILIIIVVIAYLLSRRKRTDGYQSL